MRSLWNVRVETAAARLYVNRLSLIKYDWFICAKYKKQHFKDYIILTSKNMRHIRQRKNKNKFFMRPQIHEASSVLNWTRDSKQTFDWSVEWNEPSSTHGYIYMYIINVYIHTQAHTHTQLVGTLHVAQMSP